MPPKRKLKVVVGKRQRARRVREFVDLHFNIHSENDREAVEVNVSENSYIESEEAVYEETSSDSELETSSFDFDNVTAEEDGSLREPPVADIDESEEVNYFGCLEQMKLTTMIAMSMRRMTGKLHQKLIVN